MIGNIIIRNRMKFIGAIIILFFIGCNSEATNYLFRNGFIFHLPFERVHEIIRVKDNRNLILPSLISKNVSAMLSTRLKAANLLLGTFSK